MNISLENLKKIILYFTICHLNILLIFPFSVSANPVKKSTHDFPSTDTSKNSHYGNNLFSKKSLDFDPEDEIMYNDDLEKSSLDDMSLENEHKPAKKTLFSGENYKEGAQIIGSHQILMDKNPDILTESKANKKNIVNKMPGIEASGQMCAINQGSKECLCERSCLPNLVHNFFPCQCIEILTDQHNDNEMFSSNLPSSGSENFLNYANPSPSAMPSSVCERACIPQKVVSQSPCLCDTNEKYKKDNLANSMQSLAQPSVPTLSTPLSNGMSFYGAPYQQQSQTPMQSPQYNYNSYQNVGAGARVGAVGTGPQMGVGAGAFMGTGYNNYPSTNSYNYGSNFYPASTYNQQSNMNSYANYAPQPAVDNKVKCKKACFPFVVKKSSPCTCDFNSYKSPYNHGSNSAPRDILPYSQSSALGDMDPAFDMVQSFAKPKTNNNQGSQGSIPYNNNVPGKQRDESYQDNPRRVSYTIPRHIGCYKDEKEHGRDLKIDVPIESLTVEKCVRKCRFKKKRFAGLQYGYLCFCGSRFGRYGKTDDKNCTTPCVGDHSEMCGGPWFNSIYSTDGQLYNENQFSFSSPDSMDEIKAEEEKLKQIRKAKTRKRKHLKNKKKMKKTKKHNVKSAKKPKFTPIINKPIKVELETQDAIKKDGALKPTQTKNINLEKLKNKLKNLLNKTLEKSDPPAYKLNQMNDDDSAFYQTEKNNPGAFNLKLTDMEKDPNEDKSKANKAQKENEKADEESDDNEETNEKEDSKQDGETSSNDETKKSEQNDNNEDNASEEPTTTLAPVTAPTHNENLSSPSNKDEDKNDEDEDDSGENDKYWVNIRKKADNDDDEDTNFKV